MKLAMLLVPSALWLVWVAGLVWFGRKPELRIGTARDFIFPFAALAVVLAWLLSGSSVALSGLLTLYLKAGLVVLAWVTLIWLISLAMRDTSIIDIAYPLIAFLPLGVLIAWQGNWSLHECFIVALSGLWSLRLALHIGIRNLGHGEDRRYAAWRTRFGRHWWWWSFFQVFTTQGVLVWLWVLPLVMALATPTPALGWQHLLALLVFALGFGFQVVSDAQLERFKKTRSGRGEVLDSGLWRLSRHPNYFGEAAIWCSFGVLGLVHPWGWIALACPLYVTWFMASGSATPMQERYMAKSKPAYAAYMTRVPKFFPWGRP